MLDSFSNLLIASLSPKHRAYLQSRISRKEIQALFHDPLNTPNRPLECYRELTLL